MAKWLDKYEQGGMVLKQKTHDNYGKKPNPNDVQASVGPDFVGLGYNTKGRDYSPAWGGQFAMGGALPGAVGFTYARTQDPAPSNGPYAKKTLASAQNGKKVDPNEKKYQAPDKNKIVDWFNNYYTSPFFKENLYDKGNAFMENVGDKLGKATAEKINNLNYTFKDVSSGGYYKGSSYDLENTVNMGNPNNYYNQSKSDVLSHELGHVNQDAILGQQPRNLAIMLNYNNQVNRKPLANDIYNIANEMPAKNTYGELLNPYLPSVGSYRADRLKDWVSDENRESTSEFHDQVLGEVRSDIMALRYLASKEGIWDAAKNKPGSFTPEMLDKLYKSKNLNTPQVKKDWQGNITTNIPNPKSLKPNDLKNVAPPKKPGMFLNRLRQKYNDSDLLYLMNKLAKNEENAPMDKAQNGGEMKFYQEGLDFKPKSISKNGSVIKDDMGQWAHPGEITEISGDTMATHGYGDVPLYVVPDKGSPRIVQANTGTQKFPGATKFTEYPMAQDGENISKKLKKQAEEFLAKRNANRSTLSQYTPKKGEQEKWDKEKLQRIAEDNAPLNRMAASKGAKNIQDAIEAAMIMEGGMAAGKLVGKGAKAAGKYLTEETALKNAYKLNPKAFKPNEANWYRQVGKPAIDDALQSGMIRGRNEEVSQEALTKFLSSKPGDEITAPYFSKGNVYFPDIPNKNYLIETGLPNENFQQSYMWKFGEGTGPNDMGAAVLHPDPNLRNLGNFNIYEKNWLEGYKKVPQPTNTQQITRGPINWWDEPKYKKQNPNFNPQTYLNNPVGNQFYSRDIPEGMEPRYFEDNKNGGWLNKYK